ncbi:MAG TPA: sialate O-acetylesterase, partial [Verrucomicrobiota bacterium]|nr:sialate O-acetylesterase [Verrucomicrobiota bacterium]
TLAQLLQDPAKAPQFAHLRDAAGRWTVRDDVWVRYQRENASLLRGPLTMGFSVYGDPHHFGPELQLGWVLGDFLANPVLLIKTAWGGKSLYRDFRPPSSGGPVGPYYARMIAEVREALANVETDFPGLDGRGCELAGFVWYQGWNDGCEPDTAVPQYETNLVNLIRDVRRELGAPNLPVVIGELTGPWVDAPGEWDALRKAQAAAAARPDFKGNVLFVETRDFVRKPEDSPNPGHGHHEFGNAETCFLVGDALGHGLVKLLQAAGSTRAASERDVSQTDAGTIEAGKVTAHSEGLHGYIGFGHEELPPGSAYSAGMGFYAAVWPLVDEPLADFQIGLPSAWITPDNSDNTDKPLAPEGTLARTWEPRGPTWSSVFQTVEGGLGYWAGNHFRYGPPKFSMNATPQCYDYEIGSPGWSFFYDNEALPDHRLGIAQLSNRLLIPPDALPFEGNPDGEFLGYTWMALPFADSIAGDPPTGDQSWTCFLSAANFKGPIAYYIPETWSKIGKLFNYPFLYGRGLDARPGLMGGGAMEINTVPRLESKDARGTTYSKLPKLQFPADAEGRAYLVQDVTYYSKAALYDAFKAWRNGGSVCSGRFDARGAFKPGLNTHTTRYDQAGKKLVGVETAFDTRIFEGNVWGLQWFTNAVAARGLFPQYYKHVAEERVAVPAAEVPAETRLLAHRFKLAEMGVPYTSPTVGAWARPGPKAGPFTARLADGSAVTYSWYRFVDQPSFQQYGWSEERKAKLQAFVEKLHATWPIDRDYMAPPTRGKLVALDPALLVTPPKGLDVGYVPIVTRQERQ